MTNKTVFVGLSGGVDSSVAALRLKQQGYTVVGVFIKVWQPDWLQCDWEQERLDAMRVAAHLNIPFLTCDAEARYRDEVGHYFIAEYQAGRTPNPDVLCNQHVKFGAFLDFAKAKGADFVATGHYAMRTETSEGISLQRGVDQNKDQSYFLWTLTQAQLQHILLPVGDTPKKQIRAEAAAANLPVAAKKDSQGICFLGHIDIPEFLSHYTDLQPGSVLNETGEVIGEHQGALVYTLGQRHGFTITSSDAQRTALYVVAKDTEANTITVAPHVRETTAADSITLTSCNWIIETPNRTELLAQFRYRQTPAPVQLTTVGKDTASLTPLHPTQIPAAGQSCVLYDGATCIGGGIIG